MDLIFLKFRLRSNLNILNLINIAGGIYLKKKNIFILLFGILLLLISVACGGNNGATQGEGNGNGNENENEEAVSKTDFPIVKDEIELNIFAAQSEGTADNWDDIMIWNEYADKTNIKINWEQVPSSSLEEKRNLTLGAGGTLPDVFYAASIPNLDLFKYGKQEQFLVLNDLIEEYAPNLSKLMDETPGVRQALTFPDGNIYSLPLINDESFMSMRTGAIPWIRTDWLETLEMESPETTEQLYEFLTAVKEQTPSNGEVEEIPFGAPSIDYIFNWLRGPFGIANRGNAILDIDPTTDELRFIASSDEYKEMLEFIHKLYDEELIEPNIFSLEYDQFLANGSEGRYASTVWYLPEDSFGEETGSKYGGGLALEGPGGSKMYTNASHPVSNLGQFVITKDNEHPEATMRWIDYFYSDEGSQYFYMGVEGETFEETEDGEFVYSSEILDPVESGELTFGGSLTRYLVWPGMGAPGIVKEAYFDGSEGNPKTVEAANKLEPYLPEEIWPHFTTTEEENKVLTSKGVDIEKYIIEMRDKFIVGQTPFSEWDDYIKTLEQIGLEEYMDTYQSIYDRYLEAE